MPDGKQRWQQFCYFCLQNQASRWPGWQFDDIGKPAHTHRLQLKASVAQCGNRGTRPEMSPVDRPSSLTSKAQAHSHRMQQHAHQKSRVQRPPSLLLLEVVASVRRESHARPAIRDQLSQTAAVGMIPASWAHGSPTSSYQ